MFIISTTTLQGQPGEGPNTHPNPSEARLNPAGTPPNHPQLPHPYPRAAPPPASAPPAPRVSHPRSPRARPCLASPAHLPLPARPPRGAGLRAHLREEPFRPGRPIAPPSEPRSLARAALGAMETARGGRDPSYGEGPLGSFRLPSAPFGSLRLLSASFGPRSAPFGSPLLPFGSLRPLSAPLSPPGRVRGRAAIPAVSGWPKRLGFARDP
ncbi:hypothetical protein LUU34_00724700 [Aix galericulata]|nr:hypothetical protein LUU34_00724700 [Aix galericulata]